MSIVWPAYGYGSSTCSSFVDQGKSGAAAFYRCPEGGRRQSTRSGRGPQPSERPRPGLAKSLVGIFLESWNLEWNLEIF